MKFVTKDMTDKEALSPSSREAWIEINERPCRFPFEICRLPRGRRGLK